jgi:hypothetical protein
MLLVFATALAACAPGDDSVAEVTLPELDTTTTTLPDLLAPSGREDQADEPPAPAWTVQVGGPGDDRLFAVEALDDAVVAVGSTTGRLEPGTPDAPGGGDVLVTEVDTEGELRWTRSSGSEGRDAGLGVAASAEGVLACGATTGMLGSLLGGSTDLWCGVLGLPGGPLLPDVSQTGAAEEEELSGVAASPAQEPAYAAGRVSGFLPGAEDASGRGLGAGDAVAIRLGADGRPAWARQFGTTADDAALGVALSPDDDGIFVGYTDGDLGRSSEGGRDGWISRFDPAGRQRWVTQIGSPGTDVLAAVTTAGSARRGTERFVAVGWSDGGLGGAPAPSEDRVTPTQALIGSFGPNGALEWITSLGSGSEARATAVASDGAVLYVAGTTTGELGELAPETGTGGGADGFLAAVDAATGDVRWITRFGSDGEEEVTGMALTEDGLLVLSGTTTGQMAATEPGGGIDGFLIAFPLPSSGGGAASSV